MRKGSPADANAKPRQDAELDIMNFYGDTLKISRNGETG